MAFAVRNESYGLWALRLHGQLLLDSGDIGAGLGTHALIVEGTAAKGGDFTSEIIVDLALATPPGRPVP